MEDNAGITCSRSTFFEYKPFYTEEPTERKKQSCLGIVCQNAHTKLEGINIYRKLEKLSPIISASEYLKSQKAKDLDHALYPGRTSKKRVNYYVFETLLESYVKDGNTNSYTRTTRVDKNEPVCDVYSDFISSGERYLYHRSIVKNIKSVLPKIRKSFTGKYIEMDFSQNIALKPKDEVQTAHFSGKQHSVHCSIVIDEDDVLPYVYHLIDDTGHDPSFVDDVLNNIFFSLADSKRNNNIKKR